MEEAYNKAQTGDFSASERCLEKLEGNADAPARAWSMALQAQRWHAEPARGVLPTLDEASEFRDADPKVAAGVARACAEAAKAAVIRHDSNALRGWVQLLESMPEVDPCATTWTQLSRAWLELAVGNPEGATAAVDDAHQTAAKVGLASAVIEVSVLKALIAEHKGAFDEATASARRAVRMARVEDLPQWQYLSSLVLARMRRLHGMPHLASRILRPLLAVAPPQWRGWIAWEASMAGAMPLIREIELDDENDSRGESRMLREFLVSASGGQPSTFFEAARRLEGMSWSWQGRETDARLALVAVDARQPLSDAPDELRQWVLGRTDSPPGPIRGLCIDVASDPTEPGPAAFVVAGPQISVRRIAGLGESVVEADARIERVRGKAERGPMTLAATALAGSGGISREDLFRTVYGFEYDHDVNRGLMNVLVHRVRKLVDGTGSFEIQDGDRYVLELRRSIVIPDPRCEQSLEDVMLGALARLGAQTAQSAAAGVGVPLRTAQRALARLVESGALTTDQDPNDARLLRYFVEDTTFSEPTKWS